MLKHLLAAYELTFRHLVCACFFKHALVLLLVNTEPRSLERRKSCLCECLGGSQALLFASGSLSLGGCTSAACALPQPIPVLRHSATLSTEFSANSFYPLFAQKKGLTKIWHFLLLDLNRKQAQRRLTSDQFSPTIPRSSCPS